MKKILFVLLSIFILLVLVLTMLSPAAAESECLECPKTKTPSQTASASPTETQSATPTFTASPTPNATASASPTATASASPTATASPTMIPSMTGTPTDWPTPVQDTPTPTGTPEISMYYIYLPVQSFIEFPR